LLPMQTLGRSLVPSCLRIQCTYRKHGIGSSPLLSRPLCCCVEVQASRCASFAVRFGWFTVNPLTLNDHYSSRTAPLTSKSCILYIYSTNIGTEYFKHGIYSPSFPLQNAVCFIMLTYLVPVLFTFYI
jgi:hypothetical protein